MTASGGIGARVRAARERLGWTREVLAFHAGISWSAIAQVESGRRTNLRPATLQALCRALGVSVDHVLGAQPPDSVMLDHFAFFYCSDAAFQAGMGGFLAEGIDRSEAILAVTSTANIALLREHLGDAAHHVEFVDSREFLTSPPAALQAFRSFTTASLERGRSWIRILAEPRWLERSDAELGEWTRFESIFNLVFAASPLTVACPYDERSLPPAVLERAHQTHPRLVVGGASSTSADYVDPAIFAVSGGWPG